MARLRLASVSVALFTSLAVAASASASNGKQLNTQTATSHNPIVQVSATAKKPSVLRIGVTNTPAGVKVSYTVSCVKNGSAKSNSSSYATTTTSDIRKIAMPQKKPSKCQLTATVRFTKAPAPNDGTITVTLYSVKQK